MWARSVSLLKVRYLRRPPRSHLHIYRRKILFSNCHLSDLQCRNLLG